MLQKVSSVVDGQTKGIVCGVDRRNVSSVVCMDRRNVSSVVCMDRRKVSSVVCMDRRRYRLWCIGQTKASSVELLFVSFDVFSSW